MAGDDSEGSRLIRQRRTELMSDRCILRLCGGRRQGTNYQRAILGNIRGQDPQRFVASHYLTCFLFVTSLCNCFVRLLACGTNSQSNESLTDRRPDRAIIQPCRHFSAHALRPCQAEGGPAAAARTAATNDCSGPSR